MDIERRQRKAAIICKNCGGTMRPGAGELTYRRGDMIITVDDVPMSICDSCGERYVPGSVGVALGEDIEDLVHSIEAQNRLDVERIEIRAPRAIQELSPV